MIHHVVVWYIISKFALTNNILYKFVYKNLLDSILVCQKIRLHNIYYQYNWLRWLNFKVHFSEQLCSKQLLLWNVLFTLKMKSKCYKVNLKNSPFYSFFHLGLRKRSYFVTLFKVLWNVKLPEKQYWVYANMTSMSLNVNKKNCVILTKSISIRTK